MFNLILILDPLKVPPDDQMLWRFSHSKVWNTKQNLKCKLKSQLNVRITCKIIYVCVYTHVYGRK